MSRHNTWADSLITHRQSFYASIDDIPLDGVVPAAWRDAVVTRERDGRTVINRVNYELVVLQRLREKLRCKEIWVEGASTFRNPDEDLPQNFTAARTQHYAALKLPQDAAAFIADLQQRMRHSLRRFNRSLPKNPNVRLTTRHGKSWIGLTPLDPQPEPLNFARLKVEIERRWPMTSLMDILKETDLRVDFTQSFTGMGTREGLDRATLQKRLLLCLYALKVIK